MATLARQQEATREDQDRLELVTNLPQQFWHDVGKQITGLVKQLIEDCLEAKRTEALKAASYERTAERVGHRGGTYARSIKTRYGDVEVRIPRLAQGGYDHEIIAPHQRRQEEVDEIIGRLFLAGCSTRNLEDIAERLFGYGLGRSTVSHITKALDAEVAAFRAKTIPDTVRYLLLDGISAKVREVGSVGKRFLVAYGIHEDGRKEILGFVLADAESAPKWRAFLADLKARGLRGRALRLITVDGAKGLHRALGDIYPLIPVQRCLVHKIRNVMATTKMANKAAVARSLRPIWAAHNRRQALRAVRAFEEHWIVDEERAVRTLWRDLHECLSYLEFPTEDHVKIRTTNALERAFREVRRRTRPMGSYVNKASAERIMFGVTDRLNERWRGAPQIAKSAK